MKYNSILITGGAGFVGSHVALRLKNDYPSAEIIALDNLYRRGSELNIDRLRDQGVKYIYGDVRQSNDLDISFDLLIECSAEPSVIGGINTSSKYLVDTNLGGSINCFEQAKRNRADIIFLSTSRVYPWKLINKAAYIETDTRFELKKEQVFEGITERGINENFSINKGTRSLYGATKLASELLLLEYAEAYGLNVVINRFGTIAGPGQFGKSDQGIIAYWMAAHILNKPLIYIGFDGKGKQVRDIVHVEDVYQAIKLEVSSIEKYSKKIFNIGGGLSNSVSLFELSQMCNKITGNSVSIDSKKENRKWDVKSYITDYSTFSAINNWKPTKSLYQILMDACIWLKEVEEQSKFFKNNLD